MKYCQQCGAKNKADAKFCVNCGATFNQTDDTQHEAQSGSSYEQSYSPHAQQPQPAQVQNFNDAANQTNNNSRLFLILGWMSAAVSLFFIPIIFGGIGVALGFAARKKNETQGLILIVASIICGILGVVLGAIIGSSTY
ncbi:zinc ribbon domain-containing protein [Furfurilactobacillus rossiae]|uniref:Zinc-ribbon domain-containing protein n=1 Tax=Furfurilactobacillus rossiae DSM 15814 TaxID=1114972 RepID=A0A0R1RRQ6_9LACO|nr:zinc ribbon domain-containing protein [Furfurilactobacillus rossiae]KRL56565.1 hypothetical protein FD35_GL001659 [Furfurilactobacillus rossiae DSM 15814]QFR66531.1 zinc-ribbon domain-containing protein [Furfurilactobacillus rossiae]QLE61996.1 hypothetical protein LROSRS0_1951 [Furfurilactobacillus rossiae]